MKAENKKSERRNRRGKKSRWKVVSVVLPVNDGLNRRGCLKRTSKIWLWVSRQLIKKKRQKAPWTQEDYISFLPLNDQMMLLEVMYQVRKGKDFFLEKKYFSFRCFVYAVECESENNTWKVWDQILYLLKMPWIYPIHLSNLPTGILVHLSLLSFSCLS